VKFKRLLFSSQNIPFDTFGYNYVIQKKRDWWREVENENFNVSMMQSLTTVLSMPKIIVIVVVLIVLVIVDNVVAYFFLRHSVFPFKRNKNFCFQCQIVQYASYWLNQYLSEVFLNESTFCVICSLLRYSLIVTGSVLFVIQVLL